MIDIQVISSSSAGNCYRVSDGQTALLLEAGVSYRTISKALNHRLTSVSGCLLTHEHGDHSKAIKNIAQAGINCYMSAGTKEALAIQHHRFKAVTPKETMQIGTWKVLPFDVQHDVAEPLGFLLQNQDGEKLLFATDTYYIKYQFPGLTHVLVECNYSEDILQQRIADGTTPAFMERRLLQSHFSLANVKEFLKANDLSQLEEIWLLHLSNSHSDEERFKREIMALTGIPTKIA